MRRVCTLRLSACVVLCSVAFIAAAPLGAQSRPAVAEPAESGPLATDLSPAVRSKSIRAVMKRVADRQFARAQAAAPSRTWDVATLDIGLLAAARTLHDSRYSEYVKSIGDHFGWQLERTLAPANDFALAQALLELRHDDAHVASMRRQYDDAIAVLNDPEKPAWTSCRALFMAAPAGMMLTQVTGDNTYAAYVDREWGKTERKFYDRSAHLFAGEDTGSSAGEHAGRKAFSASANGWAMAGLVRILANIPDDDPLRPHYIDLLRQMAPAIASAQSADGLWRSDLLDSAGHAQPDVAGSSLIVYALAWGIDHRSLDAEKYVPVVERAWAGLVAHIYADGGLASVQPEGTAAAAGGAGATRNFSVGAFLLAASEVDVLSGRKHW